jgi:hypothetical protein
VPAFEHVFLIMMENESQTAIQGSAMAPYINNTLLPAAAYTNNYSTTFHPSLPNYLEITSGSFYGVGCDCEPTGTACTGATCSLISGSCGCPQSAMHLGDQLDGVNVPWREYGESMGTPCNTTSANKYATKHIPFLYYTDVLNGTGGKCAQHIVDYASFGNDLTAGTYRFSMISPDLCDDMHGNALFATGPCSTSTPEITQGDTWLSTEVPKILATPGFAAGGKDVLFIAWDEQSNSTGGSNIPMLFIAVSPLTKLGATSSAYNHASLLATFEEAFGTARLNDASSAMPINDIWK